MKTRKTITEFINENRVRLTAVIHHLAPTMPLDQIDDTEIEMWVINTDGLYNWALNEQVAI